MWPLVYCPYEFHDFTSISHWPACRLTSPHLLMTRMMPWVNLKKRQRHRNFSFSQEASLWLLNQAKRTFTTRYCSPRATFHSKTKTVRRTCIVCLPMLWTEPNPFPLFNDKFISIPIAMEVKSIKFSMKLKINFIKGKSDWQYAQLIPDFQWQDFLYQFFPWGRRWIQSSLDDIENQFQQLREKLAANPNVLQLVDGGDDHEVPAEKFSGLSVQALHKNW